MIAGWKISAAVSAVVVALLIVVACAPAAAPTATPAPKPAEPPKAAAPAAPPPTQAPQPTTKPGDTAGAAAQAPANLTAIALQQQQAKPAEATKLATAPKPAAPAVAGEKITLRFLHVASPASQKAFQTMMDEYKKANPNVNIDLQQEVVTWEQLFPKIQAIAAAKTPYDVIWADGPDLWNFAYNGAILPLDEYFDRDYIQKNWLPSSLVTSYYRGRFYAPPERESCSLLWFNKDVTDQAGIDPPVDFAKSWTMEDALVAWQKVNNPPTMYALRWGQGAGPAQDYENGLFRRLAATSKDSPAFKAVADDGVTMSGYFDHPEAVKGHQFIQDIHQKYKISPVESIPDIWFSKKAAFFLSPDNAIGTYERLNPGFKYGVTGIPYFKGGTQLCHNDSLHYAVGAYSTHKKEAAEFIKFMSGPVGAKIYYDAEGQLPANVQLLNTLPAYQKYPRSLVLEQFKQVATPRVVTVGFTEYNTLATEFFGNLVQVQGANVQDLASQTAKRYDALAAKYKDWKTK